MKDRYFVGKDGNPIRKGDACMWMGDKDTTWIIMSDPCGMPWFDGRYNPNSNYMSVWAKPSTEPSDTHTASWVRRKTKGFTKKNNHE